jgi:hypothetical protein
MVTVKVTSPQKSASAAKESNTHVALTLLVLSDVLIVLLSMFLMPKVLVTNRY